MNPMALVEEFWKPILVLLIGFLIWTFWKIEEGHIHRLESQVAAQQAQLREAAGTINEQNKAVRALQTEGKEQQATIEGLAAEAQRNAGKVVVQWKTKYVPTPIPMDCSAAVAAGAANAASVAQIFMNSPSP